jgi:hypothetical protein
MRISHVVRYGDLFCQSDWTGDEAVLTILHADQAFTAQLGRSTHQCWGSILVRIHGSEPLTVGDIFLYI